MKKTKTNRKQRVPEAERNEPGLRDPDLLFAKAAKSKGHEGPAELATAMGRAGTAVSRRRAQHWFSGVVWAPPFAWKFLDVKAPPPPAKNRRGPTGSPALDDPQNSFARLCARAGFHTALDVAEAITGAGGIRQSERSVQDWMIGRAKAPPAAYAWIRTVLAVKAEKPVQTPATDFPHQHLANPENILTRNV